MYAFFFEYTAIAVLNYVSVFLGALVYALVMSKFVRTNRAVTT